MNSRTFPTAAELDGDPLVHVLAQVEDVLLLGPLLLAGPRPRSWPPAISSPSPAASAAAPAPVATTPATVATAAAAPVGFVGHVRCGVTLCLSRSHALSRPFPVSPSRACASFEVWEGGKSISIG